MMTHLKFCITGMSKFQMTYHVVMHTFCAVTMGMQYVLVIQVLQMLNTRHCVGND